MERTLQGAVSVIHCDDRLNADTVDSLSAIFRQCMDEGQPMAVLNLENTRLFSSTGLECLLDGSESFVQRGGRLKIARLTPLASEIFLITELDRKLDVYEDINQAVRSFVQ